jgi:hypothetical protein
LGEGDRSSSPKGLRGEPHRRRLVSVRRRCFSEHRVPHRGSNERARGFPSTLSSAQGPNGSSVAASVRVEEATMLLGADLEDSPNDQTGWRRARQCTARHDCVAREGPPPGSEGAHCEQEWVELVADDPVAIVTPWALAGGHLPTAVDLARLRGLSSRVYLTALPTRGPVRKASDVEKLMRKVLPGVRVEELRGWGQVRARRRAGETSWRVDLGGDAQAIL